MTTLPKSVTFISFNAPPNEATGVLHAPTNTTSLVISITPLIFLKVIMNILEIFY
jgi:hypothetical protein